jgi:serine/threonine protein kinase/tetratricopeptide (TPR) repeat protein
MTSSDRVNEIMQTAVTLGTDSDLRCFLDTACAGDAALRSQVENLLKQPSTLSGFAEAPAGDPQPTRDLPGAEAPGTVIGPFTLLQRIGEGGMGAVYMAEQTHPVQRRVAIKVIKAGLDSRKILARFEAERQTLAMMDHVNIARVLDAGTSESGRPFFAMELVQGVPMTKYCDDHRLTPRERLELFVPVCQAIQHAHQHGVIHRDIKPSNVLITLYDGKPLPKVIDFGVAKATEKRPSDRSLNTEYGAMIGTPEYMSPEQAEMSALGVDTRSDIYSLGVLLYELLTGGTPMSRQQLGQAGYSEILHLIKEVDPPRPSVRLSTSGADLASIAARRRMEPARLMKLVRGELDWIVMKSLDKDRNRRYESANSLAGDVQRYLRDETVLACPPSRWYRFRKFVRRHKAGLLMIGIVATAVLAGLVLSIWQAARAVAAERVAKEQRDVAVAAERRARESAADMAVFSAFLVKDVLAVARPKGQHGGLGMGVTVREALDAAAPKIADTFARRPRAEAVARSALGLTYMYMGDTAAAIAQLEMAVELSRKHFQPDEAEALDAIGNLAIAYQQADRVDKALPLLEEILEILNANNEADHPMRLSTMANLALAYRDMRRFPEAFALFDQTIRLQKAKFGPDDENTLSTMNNLAGAYMKDGKIDQSLALFEETLRLQRARFGADHPHTLAFMSNLAGIYRAARRHAEAIRLYQESVKRMTATLGPDHIYTLGTLSNLAVTYRDSGRLQEAMPLLEEAFLRQKAMLGHDHSYTLNTMLNLARAYQDAGRPAEAASLLEKMLKIQQARLGPSDPNTLTCMNALASAYAADGNTADAVPLFEETIKRRKAELGAEHSETLASLADLGHALLRAKRYAEAEPVLRECLAIREKNEPDAWTTFSAMSLLGGSLLGQKKHAEAEPLLRAGHEGMNRRSARIAPLDLRWRIDAAERLVLLFEGAGQLDEAGRLKIELDALRTSAAATNKP